MKNTYTFDSSITTINNKKMETITIKNQTINAYFSIEDSWNSAIANGYWGSGYILTKDGLFITLSENNEHFEYIIEELNWKFL